MIPRLSALVLMLGVSTVAHAADLKLCVVDAERAFNETQEGKAAQKKLEGMFAAKQEEISKMEKDLERQFQDYEQKKLILSADARGDLERSLLEKRQGYQTTVMQAEQEMQQAYVQMAEGIQEKVLTVASALGKSKGCSLLVPKEATIYVGPDITDLTAEVIAGLDARK